MADRSGFSVHLKEVGWESDKQYNTRGPGASSPPSGQLFWGQCMLEHQSSNSTSAAETSAAGTSAAGDARDAVTSKADRPMPERGAAPRDSSPARVVFQRLLGQRGVGGNADPGNGEDEQVEAHDPSPLRFVAG